MRVVVDTNVWLSGLMLPSSLPGHIVRAVTSGEITAVFSEPMWEELRLAMRYRKLRPRIPLTDAELDRYLAELRYMTEMVEIAGVQAPVPCDPDDHMVLATFVASRADYLLTGDADLLALRPQHAILTAREFFEQHLR